MFFGKICFLLGELLYNRGSYVVVAFVHHIFSVLKPFSIISTLCAGSCSSLNISSLLYLSNLIHTFEYSASALHLYFINFIMLFGLFSELPHCMKTATVISHFEFHRLKKNGFGRKSK